MREIPARPWRKLTTQELTFIDEYMRDCDATRAARAAGLAPSNPSEGGRRMLLKPDVVAEIERRRASLVEAAERTLEDHVRALEAVAYGKPSAFLRVDDDGKASVDLAAVPPDAIDALVQDVQVEEAAGEVVKTRLKFVSRLEALRDLAKIKGYNAAERLEVSGPGGAPVKIEDISKVSPAEAMQAYLDMVRK